MAEGKHCQWRATQYGMREARMILRRALEAALADARATEAARLRRLAEDDEAAARQGRDKDGEEKEVTGRQTARSVGALLRKDKEEHREGGGGAAAATKKPMTREARRTFCCCGTSTLIGPLP